MRFPWKVLSGLVAVASLAVPAASIAAPASPVLFPLTQPDGSRFLARAAGDEWCNWLETDRGYTIVQDSSGYWRYVRDFAGDRPVLEATYADDVPSDDLAPHRHRACVRPAGATGTTRTPAPPAAGGVFSGSVLFILASFTDQAGTYTESDFASFLRTDIHDFYHTVSHGAVTLSPARESSGTADNGVVGWLNLGYKHPNTGNNTSRSNQKLTRDAILAADASVDFRSYDANLDGYVDASELAVVVIAAGFEKSYSGRTPVSPTVWGHAWNLDQVGAPTVDGVVVGAGHGDRGGYCQFGEIHKSNPGDAHQATMGIMVHELGHLIFRLPDLYDTDYSSNGAGIWCYMSFGSWGASIDDAWLGETPVSASAWIRYHLGWAGAPTAPGDITLMAAGSLGATGGNSIYRASSERAAEYFLIENRQDMGYDRGLEATLGPGFGGLAIWHIDDTMTTNSRDKLRWVDLEEADASTTAYEPTNLWFAGNPVGSITFDAGSIPDSNLYSGKASTVSISGVSASGEVMSATVSSAYSAARRR